ncbi:aminoacyl-tRNA hydrolase [Mycoplasma struthionis]|uniref:Peptidyl-tRNA hydrolase n=1 Tax=Mycoplasma struthionis TaxID=538220 RepID=A0A502M2W8_9MOLU|nr:aminoacyl-tRNA hydrolase [Mycoplasma struthionis]TPI02564.1 aminoacyl-tRNA hydrolase [Mycoplasma struthionis]
MKLIVGLGNPGAEYQKTRHNVGFEIIDRISEKLKAPLTEKKFNGIFYKEKDFILAKPLTYMNLSGDFVRALVDYYDIATNDIIIVYDDMDLLLGKVVIKQKGSSGGQKGMKDIINKLGTNEIKRLKVGIGRGQDATSHVLGKFNAQEASIMNQVFEYSAEALISFISNDIRFVMNKYTGKIYD